MEDLRKYERKMQEETNKKVGMDAALGYTSDASNPTTPQNTPTESNPPSLVETEIPQWRFITSTTPYRV